MLLKKACVAGALCAGALPAAGSIVYNHYSSSANGMVACHDWDTSPQETSSGVEVPGGLENTSQGAQRLTLVGTDRFITKLEMAAWAHTASVPGTGPCITDITAYLYTANGTLPGTLLWSGTAAGVVMNPNSFSSAGMVNVSFFPNVTVPSTVFLGFSHQNISNQRGFMGMAFDTEPGLFAGPLTFKDSTKGLWTPSWSDAILIARLTAVPGPSAILALAIGLMPLRRRRC